MGKNKFPDKVRRIERLYSNNEKMEPGHAQADVKRLQNGLC
ncbi:hypothetical protein GCM10010911_69490 [Paenibacillus nasutitermitis]|uniref:Uncharacterized protein n=1 Tax=Paenibacillus nasutitermitis TaxID=1652958 RepID=A0A916ZJ29_9BACL|nr:hypothetical protein GCM10010911_69490 [Paenibacillus nasutitermitis]